MMRKLSYMYRMAALTMMSLRQWWEKEIQKLILRRGVIHLFHNSAWGVVRDSEGRYIKGFKCFSPMFFFDGEVDGWMSWNAYTASWFWLLGGDIGGAWVCQRWKQIVKNWGGEGRGEEGKKTQTDLWEMWRYARYLVG